MRAFVLKNRWHRIEQPNGSIESIDLLKPVETSSEAGKIYRLATGSNDSIVYIWLIDIGRSTNQNEPIVLSRASLRHHQYPLRAVRFSPNQILASGDCDGKIFLWRHDTEQEQERLAEPIEPNAFTDDDGFENLECWQLVHVRPLKHYSDISDLSWSKSGQFLLSGSVDNSTILWDALKGTLIWRSDPIHGYIHGVSIDPRTKYFAIVSSVGSLRIFDFNEKRQLTKIQRMVVKGKFTATFRGDTLKTLSRRLEFSPDGKFLIVPCGRVVETKYQKTTSSEGVDQSIKKDDDKNNSFDDSIEVSKSKKIKLANNSDNGNSEPPSKPINSIFVFKVPNIDKPSHYYPTGNEIALCVKFSPVIYTLRDGETNFWGIPYRLVFAVATTFSVMIYDSQQAVPIGYVSQIHVKQLTDLSWSHDGCLLAISSDDGWLTTLTFEEDEFGERYTSPLLEVLSEPVAAPQVTSKPISQRRTKTTNIISVSRQPTLNSLWKR